MTRWSDDSPFSVYWREQVKKFNESGKGITLVDESLSDETAYLDKLRSQIATGTQPEIFIEYGGSRIIGLRRGGHPGGRAALSGRRSGLEGQLPQRHHDQVAV
jgi:ABC-type glycerol-3-phosphate transport system substrate-binding protein